MSWKLYSAKHFTDVASEWDALNSLSGAVPFLFSGFVSPLLREFGTGQELIATSTTNGAVDAMAIVAPGSRTVWETFQPSQLPLGAWIMRPGQTFELLLPGLLQELPGFALNLGITQQDPRIIERLPDGDRVRCIDYIQTAWIELDGTFDAYWESRGKNLRQNLAKQRRKLETDGIVPVLDVLTRPEDVAEGLRDYGDLESRGWKAEGGTAIHPDNAQGRFYQAMLEAFCARGSGRIYRYRFNDKVVAVDLCVENEDSQVVLKTTYDETYRTISPAFLMRQDELKGLWTEGRIKRVEFYGKLMEWHTRWTDNARTLYHLNFYRWGFLPGVHAWLAARRKPKTEPVAEQPASVKG